MTCAASLRLGLFLVFFLAYFGGYPAIQFQERHYFHLEFMGLWAIAFVAHHDNRGRLVAEGPAFRHEAGGAPARTRRRLRRGDGSAVCLRLSPCGSMVSGARARQLIHAYIAAPKVAVPNPAGALTDIAPTAWPQFLEVDLNEAACGDRPAVTFHYDRVLSDGDFTWTVTIERRTHAIGPTRILMPVFERFAGLELSDAGAGCFAGAYRFTRPPTCFQSCWEPRCLPTGKRCRSISASRSGKAGAIEDTGPRGRDPRQPVPHRRRHTGLELRPHRSPGASRACHVRVRPARLRRGPDERLRP